MPILSIRSVCPGRKDGLVARAAYCGRRRFGDERRGRVFDFSHRPGLAWSELSLPDALAAPGPDPERLWNTIEAAGARGAGACELVMGLPRGRSLAAHAAFVRDFLIEAFVAHGQAVDWHIHYDKAGNPHAHALASPAWPGLTPGIGAPGADKPSGGCATVRAQWRRHCARWGLVGGCAAACPTSALPACADALKKRGIVTRQWQSRAASQALVAHAPGRPSPAWPRLRARQRTHAGRERAACPRQDRARWRQNDRHRRKRPFGTPTPTFGGRVRRADGITFPLCVIPEGYPHNECGEDHRRAARRPGYPGRGLRGL
ncbi:MobA/MobL family protein [Acidiferrobacter sp.]|uniref:MobA/MobL family protein n=1 Tax=Acidiferrobacter sp. TaxID=1872107 RepID=UPI00344C19E9